MKFVRISYAAIRKGWWTGLVFENSSDTETALDIQMKNYDGSIAGQASITIPPNGFHTMDSDEIEAIFKPTDAYGRGGFVIACSEDVYITSLGLAKGIGLTQWRQHEMTDLKK